MAFRGEIKDVFGPNSMKINTDNYFTQQMQDSSGKYKNKKAMNIPMVIICQRYENLFIKNSDDLKVLKNSIKEVGLKNPITVVSINVKIDSLKQLSRKEDVTDFAKKEIEKELKYLEEQLSEGKEYTISAGHRRFDASMALLLETFYGEDSIDYSKNISSQFELVGKELNEKAKVFRNKTCIKAMLTEEEESLLSKYEKLNIDVIVDDEDFDIESDIKVYQDTNLTARAVTKFEIISTVYKDLNLSGEIANFLDGKGKLDYAKLRNYLMKTKNESIDTETIRRSIKMYDMFREDLKERIYNGKLVIGSALRILPKYELLSNKQIDDLIVSIDEGNFDLKEWLKQFAAPAKKKYETKEEKIRKEFVLVLKRIESGKLSIEDAIKIYSV